MLRDIICIRRLLKNAQWAIVVRVCKMEVLTEENINPAFNRVKYDIRGWLEDRAHEIRQELARVSVTFDVFDTRWELERCLGKRETTQRIKLHDFLSCKWGRVCSMSVTVVGQSLIVCNWRLPRMLDKHQPRPWTQAFTDNRSIFIYKNQMPIADWCDSSIGIDYYQ